MTASYAVVEVIGGLVTGSLALISDAAHMGTDVLGLGLALAAIYLAKRPAAGQLSGVSGSSGTRHLPLTAQRPARQLVEHRRDDDDKAGDGE